MMKRRRIDVCAIQEVHYKGNGARIIEGERNSYKIWWSGGEKGERGIAVIMRKNLAENVIEVKRMDDRMMKVKMIYGEEIINFFSVYAPHQGLTERYKEEFREKLSEIIYEIPTTEMLIVLGDLNGQVGTEREGFEEFLGKFGVGMRNSEGEGILQLCQQNNLKIVNTWYEKKVEHLITYKSGNNSTQIDYILMRKNAGIQVRNCKVIPGEAFLTQHRLLCADLTVKNIKRPKRKKGERRIKVWKLKGCPNMKKEYQRKLVERMDNEENGWIDFRSACVETAREVCGETTGNRHKRRETWWWCMEVKEAIGEKTLAFKEWQRNQTEENRKMYREKANEAKYAVRRAKDQSYEEWDREINSNEGRLKMFKIAKQMKREGKDIEGGKYIKDERGNIRFEEGEIKERWRRYYDELTNGNNPYELSEGESKTEGPIEKIEEIEIRKAIKDVKSGKATGPSGFSNDMLKAAGEVGVEAMTEICQKILEQEEIPEEWCHSFTIPTYKDKGDALMCENYRGIRYIEHGMKVWEKVLEKRLKNILSLDKCHFGFIEGRSTTDAIFIIRQLKEKYQEKKEKLYHVFVDLEKAFDRVPREVIRWALRRQKVPEKLIKQVMALYKNTRSRVKVKAGISEEFEIGVGVHQGSGLSPLLFIVVMNEVTKEGLEQDLWELLYADDIVLTARTKNEVIEKFNKWKKLLEKRGLKVNMKKTKGMISGKEKTLRETGQYPCGVCKKGVGNNSILCTRCQKWCHKRCSNMKNLSNMGNDFKCPECIKLPKYPCGCCGKGVGVNSVFCNKCEKWCHFRCSGLKSLKDADDNFRCLKCVKEQEIRIKENFQVDGGELQEVESFNYLGEKLECGKGAEAAVRNRIAAAWRKWKELESLLVNQRIPLKNRVVIHRSCIRRTLLYGAEVWPLTLKLEGLLESCENKMLRRMLNITWEDKIKNEEIWKRCGVERLNNEIRRSRMRWYGHVMRREDEDFLRRALEHKVEKASTPGRPNKRWLDCVKEDMEYLGIKENDVMDRKKFKKLINRPTPCKGKKRRKTK